ncbi:MAG: hypothetical protein B6U88_00825 [Candidatus Aenigmarchaeota archaeon ex4484_56]|nr:MAG: hypothetical protein B6U88_00825 [Candidatus Aenigmarchaeota archaeon ex4484_56]
MVLQESGREREIRIPRKTIYEMIKVFQKMESVMSTIEILVDKESMKAIRQSKEDLLKGRYIEGKPENLDKILAREDEL